MEYIATSSGSDSDSEAASDVVEEEGDETGPKPADPEQIFLGTVGAICNLVEALQKVKIFVSLCVHMI